MKQHSFFAKIRLEFGDDERTFTISTFKTGDRDHKKTNCQYVIKNFQN